MGCGLLLGGAIGRQPSGRSLGYWECALEGDCGTLVISSSPLLLPGHEGSNFSLTHAPTMMLLSHLQQRDQSIMDSNLQNCETK
jgi:hypothetical protein